MAAASARRCSTPSWKPNGLKPLTHQLEAVDLLPSVAFDRCRIYVPGADATRARELLEQADNA